MDDYSKYSTPPTNVSLNIDDKGYPWAADPEETRRTFVFELMADPEIDPKILIANMDLMIEWLKSGTTKPEKKEPKPYTKLSAV